MKLKHTSLPFTHPSVCTYEQMLAYHVCATVYADFHSDMVALDSLPVESCEMFYNALETAYDNFIRSEILYANTESRDTVNALIYNNLWAYLQQDSENLSEEEVGKLFKYPEEQK